MALEPLLITRADLVKYTAMNGNIDSDKFLQFIKIAQDIHIQNYLGAKLFERLKEDIRKVYVKSAGTISVNNSGTGYTTATNISTTAQTGNGTGMIVSYTAVGGQITSVTLVNGGQNYSVGDTVTINSGNADALLNITALYSIPTNYNNLLEKYVKPMLVHWALYEYLPFSAYNIANRGVYKHSSDNAVNVEKSEMDSLIAKQMDIAEQYTNRFLDHIAFNQSLYPEYQSNTNGDVYPSTNNNFSGWYL